MTDQNTNRADAHRIDDAELAEASGGKTGSKVTKTAKIYISGSIECGMRSRETGEIIYRPCPRCNKPMHTEWYAAKWYCDPCNFSEYRPRKAVWNGTEKSLIAAAR